jgi:hypothetical protein
VLPLFLPSFGALLFQKPFKRRDERAAGQTLSDAVEKVKGVEDPNIARYCVLMRTLIVAFIDVHKIDFCSCLFYCSFVVCSSVPLFDIHILSKH